MRGGRREGAGRKAGSHKGETRKSRSIRATDREYQYISRFASLLKYGHTAECEAMVERIEEIKGSN